MEKVVGFLLGASLGVQLTAFAQPQIVQHPQSRTAVAGAHVTFSVEANGAVPLRYQWQLNGQDIPGATASTLKRTASPTRAGVYSVRVRDTGGEVSSAGAQLEVVKRPKFLVQPKNSIVGEHTVAVFTTVLNDSGPYQRMIWHNTNPIEGPHEIPPSTGYITDEPILRMENPINDPTWNSVYWLAVTNSAAGVTSRRARLTVVGAPVLRVQPQDQTVKAGTTVRLTVRVVPNPGPPETFQWHSDAGVIPGATAPTLVLRRMQPDQEGNYFCVVNGMGGTTVSWGAQVNVVPAF